MERAGFVFYKSFFEAISELDDADRLKMYDAVSAYALIGKEPELPGVLSALFKLMRPQIDANNIKYQNGCRGGRPKTDDEPYENQNETSEEPSQNQSITEPEPKDKEKEKDKVKENEKDILPGKPDIVTLVIGYLNQKAKTQYRASSEKTKKLIRARVSERFTLDDFKTVIDKKCADWMNDEKMCKYIRPETLFGTKFESYLNEKKARKKTDFAQHGFSQQELERDRAESDDILKDFYEGGDP